MSVTHQVMNGVAVITIDRPAQRNAVDAATALKLADAFRAFDADAAQSVAILTGATVTSVPVLT